MSIQRHIDGYRVVAHIGTGAASVLYAVQDPRTKQVWALKQVTRAADKDRRFLEQVEQEYLVGSKLDHESIRGVERIVRHRKLFTVNRVSLIMELVDGISLDRKLPKSYLKAVRIFRDVARGLAHMHSQGFAHADMKPSNILLTDDDRVKIIDLGQACELGCVKKRIQGTPGYMAPEQAHRQAITAQTDIYNFGATMYWVLTRDVIPTALPPKEDSNSLYSGALDAEMVKPPVPPIARLPDMPPLLSADIMECVQIHPDDRPSSMEQIVRHLDTICRKLEADGAVGDPA